MSLSSASTASAAQTAEDVAGRFSHLSLTAGDVVFALAVLLLAWMLARLARRGMDRAVAQLSGVSDDLRSLTVRLAGYLVMFIGVGLALSVLGAQIQPLLATAILIGVVLVLALRGIADNFTAGIVIQTRRPVHLGDAIEALGYVGVVRELNSRSVVVETADGRTVHLPNHKLLNGPIVNDTVAGRRRAEVEVRMHRAADSGSVTEQLAEVVGGTPAVLSDPAPAVLVVSSGPERITFKVRFWHLPPDGPDVTSSVVRAIGDNLHAEEMTVVAPPSGAPLTPPARL